MLDKAQIIPLIQIENTLVMEFPYKENTYCFSDDSFKSGDIITDGTEEYTILEDRMLWSPSYGVEMYYIYTTHKEIRQPIGKKLVKVKTAAWQ